MVIKNALYAQSGGVTSVINASAAGVIEQSRKYPEQIGKLLAAKNGILGVLRETLYDTTVETAESIAALRQTPGGAFGSCRYKFKNIDDSFDEYQRLIDVFDAHNIGYFFYNGGNDSADTCLKVAQMAERLNYPLKAIHVPKTIDNDLPQTDNCPGFGSVAKYVAVSTAEASLDIASMCETSTKVFIMEVMGRHAGWIAASAGVIANNEDDAPHIILMPERAFNRKAFTEKVRATVEKVGYCVVVASEGVSDEDGNLLAESGGVDAFGHKQLGGIAPALAKIVDTDLGLKYHWAVLDYLQRSARHLSSEVDLQQAYAVGTTAVDYAIQGMNSVMPAIQRTSNTPYQWELFPAPLDTIANVEKKMPDGYITDDGFGITDAAKDYFMPLIQGEPWPEFRYGLPVYAQLKLQLVKQLMPN